MRRVFVGSSGEAIFHARQIEAALKQLNNIEVVVWEDAFALGSLTFEAIEALTKTLSGAIIIASPDDSAQIRGTVYRIPRSNVILEWGYLTAILERPRVVLCNYEDVELPSNLKSLTYCWMGPYAPQAILPPEAIAKLEHWAERLPATLDGVPLRRVVSGYSGTWDVQIDYSQWRNIDLTASSTHKLVHFDGSLILALDEDGNGTGVLFGLVHIQIDSCEAAFRTADLVDEAECLADGSLRLVSHPFLRQRQKIRGTPPQEDGFIDELPGPNRFEMTLRQSSAQTLSGEHRAVAGIHTPSIGRVVAHKKR